MDIRKILRQGERLLDSRYYSILDRIYLRLDRRRVHRTRNIRLIPVEPHRRGGKHSYAEWAHVIGIFQTLIYVHLESKDGNRILDVGCGTGLLRLASDPYIGASGRYVGIDVREEDIEFCRQHYSDRDSDFIHFAIENPAYAPGQDRNRRAWPLESSSFDLVTALSVWTHLNEADASFYFEEVARVLKPGGIAMITFFLLEDWYTPKRSAEQGRYHSTPQEKWIFDQPAYGSDAWFHPSWARVPESALGVTSAGLQRLTRKAGVDVVAHYPGNWKEAPGAFFQDVLVFRKG